MVTDPLEPLTHVSNWSRNLQTSLIVNLRFGLPYTILRLLIYLFFFLGERLSHAVGCAFALCLERKLKRDKDCEVRFSS